jgi:hypothetical protein
VIFGRVVWYSTSTGTYSMYVYCTGSRPAQRHDQEILYGGRLMLSPSWMASSLRLF